MIFNSILEKIDCEIEFSYNINISMKSDENKLKLWFVVHSENYYDFKTFSRNLKQRKNAVFEFTPYIEYEEDDKDNITTLKFTYDESEKKLIINIDEFAVYTIYKDEDIEEFLKTIYDIRKQIKD